MSQHLTHESPEQLSLLEPTVAVALGAVAAKGEWIQGERVVRPTPERGDLLLDQPLFYPDGVLRRVGQTKDGSAVHETPNGYRFESRFIDKNGKVKTHPLLRTQEEVLRNMNTIGIVITGADRSKDVSEKTLQRAKFKELQRAIKARILLQPEGLMQESQRQSFEDLAIALLQAANYREVGRDGRLREWQDWELRLHLQKRDRDSALLIDAAAQPLRRTPGKQLV